MHRLTSAIFLVSTLNFASILAKDVPSKELIFPDVDGREVLLNPPGRVTLILYANPDMEQQLRDVIKALEPFRAEPSFFLVRVVDFRGGIPPSARAAVRKQIRTEIGKENEHLKSRYAKAGIKDVNDETAPIIPDFNESVLDNLNWPTTTDSVRFVLFDRSGKEIQRNDNVQNAKSVTAAVKAAL